MNPAHPSDHGHPATSSGGQPYFSDAEWQALRANDKYAGGMVIGLMTGIFVIGVLLYIGVCLSIIS